MNPIKVNKRHIILASILLSLGTALGINYWFAPEKQFFSNKKNEIPISSNIGDAVYVNSSKVENDNKKVEDKNKKNADQIQEFFDSKKSERDKNRKKLMEVMSKTDAESLSKMTKEFRQEINIEDLIKAKLGDKIIDCMAIIGDDGCNFIISSKNPSLTDENIRIVKDVIHNQTGFKNEKIKIIEKN